MPFTVSCSACNARFLLGDDLFRRKVSGKVVTVRCRSCNAEIAVDATEPATLPSHDAPVAAVAAPRAHHHPAPPRPKHKEGGATGTPLPGPTGALPPKAAAATGTPLPKPPVPRANATATPLPAGALMSIWDAAEKNAGPRKPPAPAQDLELITDFEESPPSSSDAPTLTELRHEASPPKKPKLAKKAPDEFLVNLSAGTGGIVGAPTIDVSSLVSPPAPPVEELLEVEATELTPPPARKATMPLFDMSAVLPAANENVKSLGSSLSPSHVDVPIDDDLPVTPSQKARERKHVVAPKTTSVAPPPKAKRGGAVWFVLVAAAAGVVAIVGLRGRGAPVHAPEPEASAQAAPSTTLVEAKPSTDTAATAAAPAEVASEAPPSASATEASSAKPSSTAAPASANTGSSVKSTDSSKAVAAEPTAPKPEATAAVEKPAEAEKPAAPAPRPVPAPAEPGTEFDRGAAVSALKAAAAEASACRKDGDPSGTATLTITFAPSGRVTSANIQGPPFAGTPTGGCIANAMRHASVPAFSGDRVTVNKTIVIQ